MSLNWPFAGMNTLCTSELKSLFRSFTLRSEKGENVLNLLYNPVGTHQAQPHIYISFQVNQLLCMN